MLAHAVPIDVKEKGVMWLLPPYSRSVRHIAQKLAPSSSVVAKWRLELVTQELLPKNERISSVDGDKWPAEHRFSVVLETASLSEMELADYCRRQGIFVEQVKEWRVISIKTHEMKLTKNSRADKELRDIRSRLR